MKKIGILSLSGVILLVLAVSGAEAQSRTTLPRLVVQITIDQLRGDLPLRYQDRFVDGGFRYFLNQGTWYIAANHPHAFTETIVGHTTLATGAYPSRHGMIGNRWFDRVTGKFVDNIVDKNYRPVGDDKGKGASPNTILTTTFGDELAITTGRSVTKDGSVAEGSAKIFGVSLKDRGAVSMAGHTGKAFWYSTNTGCFMTSSFYYETLPSWVKTFCSTSSAEKYRKEAWTPLHNPETYVYHNVKNVYPEGTPPEKNMAILQDVYMFGRTFPHPLAAPDSAGKDYLFMNLTISPFGDELTLDFAKELVRQEQLGKDDVPDYLAISFSATDYLTHWFSPASMESEDNLLRLDRTLRDLLAFLDKEVGLDKTLIVLSGDHGGPEYPEYLQSIKIDTGRIPSKTILDTAKAALADPVYDGVIMEYARPYFYLDRKLIQQRKLNLAAIQRTIATAVTDLAGIQVAVPASGMAGDSEADAQLTAQIRRNYDPTRSGDVYVVQQPQWQIDAELPPNVPNVPLLLEHDAPWAYDTYVPVAFAGFGVPRARVTRSIDTVDVAATLASALRTKFPSGCVGVPLSEVLPSTPPSEVPASVPPR